MVTVRYLVTDVERSVAFYVGYPGFTRLERLAVDPRRSRPAPNVRVVTMFDVSRGPLAVPVRPAHRNHVFGPISVRPVRGMHGFDRWKDRTVGCGRAMHKAEWRPVGAPSDPPRAAAQQMRCSRDR